MSDQLGNEYYTCWSGVSGGCGYRHFHFVSAIQCVVGHNSMIFGTNKDGSIATYWTFIISHLGGTFAVLSETTELYDEEKQYLDSIFVRKEGIDL